MTKILIVDDSLFMRQMLKNILPKDKFEVIGEASTGREAIERYNELKPDVVTMDITMPDMDGIQAVKAIKQIDPSAKIIMCSAMGQRPVLKEALDSGAIDFIIKPFEENKVIELLNEIYEE